MRLTDRVAIVTGGAGGLGTAYALAIAREGGHVAVVDVADAQPTAEAVRALGQKALAVRADLTNENATLQMAEQVAREFGRIDILVNNAGGGGGGAAPAPIEELDVDHWNRVIAVNLTSAALCAKAVVPHMKRRGYGKIVNVSSRAARSTGWFGSLAPVYVCAKIGVIGLTRQLAKDLGPFGINVNCLVPSFVISGPRLQRLWDGMTDAEREQMLNATPLRRLPRTEELASAVVFLVSEESSYVTGVCLDVNGGSFMA